MLDGVKRLIASALSHAFAPLRAQVEHQGRAIAVLTQDVQSMSTAQQAVMADIATIKGQVATMAANYAAAAAAQVAAAVAAAKVAWDADDEAAWNTAHAALSDVQGALAAGQPITPPATPDNPSPTPVPAPTAVSGAIPEPSGGSGVATSPAASSVTGATFATGSVEADGNPDGPLTKPSPALSGAATS